ncbi:DNA polymerase III subunit gamma/tau [Duncaniella sp.]|uniref:DNA polymerase III subunit gamma/tau n=1 Tax=Duncaniella sp. TaxID=2518496 RepID=UPI0023C45FDA|nr:DNA polymerase III subunit gamma/tau [Duncaniella sp.]MDE5904438.1 DNA polymerase III subunit gamma/tau [Duncaniella sp.]
MENYIVSARKYRPATFDSVVGQQALTATLKNAIATHRLAHSYLFCGSRGVGKTSCARIFAKTINCANPTPDGEACNECDSCRAFNDGNSLNIIELDAASNNGVDDIRQLVEQVQIPPSQGSYRVFIVDEVHMLSPAAFNAFLKTLEEPPSYVIFILATTEKHKIIPTILSRCQIYDFKRITVRDMIDHLSYVASKEGMTADPAALNIIARKADGAMRDALSIFDQVAASSRGNITYQSAIDNLNVLDYNYYNRLLDCFLEGKVLETWMIYKEIRDRGFDSHFFINGLADYMRDLMVARDPSTIVLLEADDEARKAMAATAAKCSPDFIYRVMNLCNEADLNYRTASNKQFLIELTLAKICQLLSPSHDNGAQGEGRLQKITSGASDRSQSPAANPASSQPAPSPRSGGVQPAAMPQAMPAAPSQPQAVPAMQPAPAAGPMPQRQTAYQAPTTPTPTVSAPPAGYNTAPARQTAPLKRPLMRPAGTFSINHSKDASQSASVQPGIGTTAPKRNEPYTREQLNKAWQNFMQAHPTEHILINTMRASFPAPQEGHTYKIMVENEMQRQTVEQAFPALLQAVRNDLSNDHFSLTVEINQGAASPHTWNEREVLNHMVENIPALRGFIDDLGLTIG